MVLVAAGVETQGKLRCDERVTNGRHQGAFRDAIGQMRWLRRDISRLQHSHGRPYSLSIESPLIAGLLRVTRRVMEGQGMGQK
jgi:hypothetical protein